ncbi:MAG TPA: VOC family protein [Caulobacterales bacterium]|nr:VOC family protein [Caulobacterales bacterium]
MKINAYLNFGDRRCREAFEFYARVLGGEITMMQSHGESPMADQMPDWKDAIIHARLELDGQMLMGSDAPPQFYTKPAGLWVNLQFDEAADGERVFNAFADGGEVRMPFAQTFWAHRFGMVVDRFGTPWMINCEQAD